MRPKYHHALLGAILITLGSFFMVYRLYAHFNRSSADLGLSIFDGKLPPIPHYDESPGKDSRRPFATVSDAESAEHIPKASSIPLPLPPEPTMKSI
ncbi:hypothetical protein N7456_010540 [Penicillium angulare]|uniref:Uncharacterized protein n=1 Tax=Penicillium angulare TaxID=116970 RepID=A0A9W9K6B0_9EURO|nr:hypothetical protein N7456_010540 [Penicillium angulare]